ncbi:MAG: hypothetical protein ABW061_04425, partial [Polyangiaceae bacterium]
MLGALFAFVLLMAIAMQLYPGGNWLDPAASGHRFFYNFFCDLTQPVSLSGVDNRLGAGFARVGMWCFALALGGFFWLVPLHFASTVSARVGLWVRRLGECAVLGVALVPLLPSQKFGHFHGLLTLSASALGILAALAAVIALCRSEPRARWLGGLGALALALGAFDALLFAYHLKDSAPPPLLLPAAQKVTALLLSAWMIGVAWYL